MEEIPSEDLVNKLRSKVQYEVRKLSDGETILTLPDGREFPILDFDIKEEMPTTSFGADRGVPIRKISFTAFGEELATFFADMVVGKTPAEKLQLLVSRQANGSLTIIRFYGFFPNNVETSFDEDEIGFQTHYEGSCDYYTID